jgi:hypothetical protein
MKRDLLQECNDQRTPPKDFTQTFCVRCRNRDCVNAGWAGSTFEERVGTQVDRLLNNPIMARPEDSRFDPVRAMHFVEVAQAIVLRRRADPWAGPGVFLAEPDPAMATLPTVEDAVAKLAEARGRKPTAVTVEVEPELHPPSDPPPAPQMKMTLPESHPAPPPVLPPPVVRSTVNTEFPDEGVMLGGSPPPPREGLVSADPWAPKPKHNVVPPGAKIKMGS